MLAYVFWHWPYPDADVAAYESAERDFHAALAQAAPDGFLRSAAFRVDGEAPWLAGTPAYSDWYLVQNSAALDPLNTAAVAGVCEEPHQRLTRGMAAGAGGLHQLRSGELNLADVRHATWLVKPRDMPYATFYQQLAPAPGSLWRRQMVLGPTPEFVVLSTIAPDLPATFSPVRIEFASLT